MSLDGLAGDDVEVQLVHGPVGAEDDLRPREVVPMVFAGTEDDGRLRYEAAFRCDEAGRYGFTVRVVPKHQDLVNQAELGLVAWAAS